MKIQDIIEGKSENRELWDRIKSKGVVPSIDRERYTDLSGEGLEGPFRMKNGQVLYYDPKEGKYYNRDTDMYVDYDDYRAMNEEDAYDKDVKPSGKPHDKEAAAKRAKAAALAAAKKAKEQGMAEASGDQVKKVFKKNGEPVGEVGIDPEASPGNGQWYMKCYAYNIDNSGYDSYEEAVEELKYCLKQGVAEGDKRPDYVVKASDKPKKVKPSTGGSSTHPYQGKLVGEADSPRVDSLVTDALKIMRGPELADAVRALKTVLGDREFSSRRGHYNFFIRQMMDMYKQQGT